MSQSSPEGVKTGIYERITEFGGPESLVSRPLFVSFCITRKHARALLRGGRAVIGERVVHGGLLSSAFFLDIEAHCCARMRVLYTISISC